MLTPCSAVDVVSALDLEPAPFLRSRAYRQRLVAQASYSLYRWYFSRSQRIRNWNPDESFDWRAVRRDHSAELITVIEGFYAVEQYVPDYTAELTRMARSSYGQSQFQLRWGSEEQKHAELWRNVLLFGHARTPAQIETYTRDLRASAWSAPFDSPLQMLFYTIFQERATQLIYLNTARIARGEHGDPRFAGDRDPVLARAIATIARDEAAHYDFFLELARVHLDYFPEESLQALVEVLRNFTMPAASIVPNYDQFIKVLYETQLFGPLAYGRDVAKPALTALGITSIKAIEAGIHKLRETPDPAGEVQPRVIPEGCSFDLVEATVRRLFERFRRYEEATGLSAVQPTHFVPYSWTPRRAAGSQEAATSATRGGPR